MPSASTGTTATPAAFIPGITCGGTPFARVAKPRLPPNSVSATNPCHPALHQKCMPPHFFDLCVILVAGLMVGVELSVAAFVHPAISRLPDHAHAASARALARVFGGWMPFWDTRTLIASVVEVWTHWKAASSSARWLMAAALLWLLSIVFTLSFPAPLNKRVKS